MARKGKIGNFNGKKAAPFKKGGGKVKVKSKTKVKVKKRSGSC